MNTTHSLLATPDPWFAVDEFVHIQLALSKQAARPHQGSATLQKAA